MSELTIKRGDIFFVSNFDPNDPKPGRPVLVVSSDYGNRASNYISVVPLSLSNNRPMGTHVKIVCRQMSNALCESVTTIRREHFEEYIRTATEAEMAQIDRALQCALGLPQVNPTPEVDENTLRVRIERDVYKELVKELATGQKTA